MQCRSPRTPGQLVRPGITKGPTTPAPSRTRTGSAAPGGVQVAQQSRVGSQVSRPAPRSTPDARPGSIGVAILLLTQAPEHRNPRSADPTAALAVPRTASARRIRPTQRRTPAAARSESSPLTAAGSGARKQRPVGAPPPKTAAHPKPAAASPARTSNPLGDRPIPHGGDPPICTRPSGRSSFRHRRVERIPHPVTVSPAAACVSAIHQASSDPCS